MGLGLGFKLQTFLNDCSKQFQCSHFEHAIAHLALLATPGQKDQRCVLEPTQIIDSSQRTGGVRLPSSWVPMCFLTT